ncbi:MAG: biotin--[acetyl-CoA-carboxylase] ligase [Muribaculaceae bacterium]|nr:biotin--[acetyl-CoA-carboxylase] ligase [Muribaculaceae bacterium]
MNVIRLKQTSSTNTAMKGMDGLEHGTVVVTDNQTAGRGQRGNSWEAAPGKNLTFSVLLEPQNIAARSQFAISRAVALAVADCIAHWLRRDDVRLKWPNDIYVGDDKICGILIENTLEGDRIARSVVGVGINVNQREFMSDAPNPVSMWQIAGMDFDLDILLEDVVNTILSYVAAEDCSGGHASEREYMERLWHADGFYWFAEGNARIDGTPVGDNDSRKVFEARIIGIDGSGMMTLQRRDLTLSTYAFKEVSFLRR